MAVILYAKGSCEAQKVDAFSVASHIATGNFFLRREDAIVSGQTEEDLIREEAKKKGVSHWWTKSIENLRLELSTPQDEALDDNEG